MMTRLGVFAALLLPAAAQAGGYYYSDSGIVATGRGGAWVAGADTQFAQHYNPAGLIRVREPTFNLGWSGVAQYTRWNQRTNVSGCTAAIRASACPAQVHGNSNRTLDKRCLRS